MRLGAVDFIPIHSKELSKLLNEVIIKQYLHYTSKVGVLASVMSCIGFMFNLNILCKSVVLAWLIYLVVNLIILLLRCKSPLLLSDTVIVDNFDINSKCVSVHYENGQVFTKFNNVLYCICKIGSPAIVLVKGGIVCVQGKGMVLDENKDEEA